MSGKISIRRLVGFIVLVAVLLLAEFGMLRWERISDTIPAGMSATSSSFQMLAFGVFVLLLAAIFFFLFHLDEKRQDLVITVLILVCGTVIALTSPVLNGYDEQAHFYKTVATLDGKMFRYSDYSYDVSKSYALIRDNMFDRWYSQALRPAWSSETVFAEALVNGYAQPTYPFYGYLFCAAGLGFGELFRLPAGICFILGRLFNLLGYAALVYIALKLVPEDLKGLKTALMLTACMPGTLFVAAHYTQDGVVYGIIFLLIILFVRLYRAEGNCVRDYIRFAVLFLLLVPMKYPYIFLGFLLLLVSPKKTGIPKLRLWTALLAVLSVALAAVWFVLISSQFQDPRVPGVNGTEQLKFMIGHAPLILLNAVISFFSTIVYYLANAMRIFGGFDWYASLTAGAVFGAGTIGLIVLSPVRIGLNRTQKLVLAVISAFVVLATEAALYVSYNTVGSTLYIEGVQGRYFYGLLLLLPLFVPERVRGSIKIKNDVPWLFLLAELSWFTFGLSVFL